MKVSGYGSLPDNSILSQQNIGRSSVPLPHGQNLSSTKVAQLAAIFVDSDINVASSQLTALETALSQIGLALSDMDESSVLRALLLKQNSIPLTKNLLKNDRGLDNNIYKQLAVLRQNAADLLADKHISVNTKAAIEVMLHDLGNLFKGEISPQTALMMLDNIVGLWAGLIEGKLRLLAEGKLSMSDMIAPTFTQANTSLDNILNTLQSITDEPEHVPLIKELMAAVSELRASLHQLSPSIMAKEFDISEPLSVFHNRLLGLASQLEGLLAETLVQPVNSGFAAVFLEDTFAELRSMLTRELQSMGINPVFTDSLGDPSGTLWLKNMLSSSGLNFEWRLLAWYRSGAHPGHLTALMQDDLKGILLRFLNGLRKGGEKSRVDGKTARIMKTSEDVLDSITRRQIDFILENKGAEKGLYFETPANSMGNDSEANIFLKEYTQPDENDWGKRNFTIRLSVETSRIGKVDVNVTVSGQGISLGFDMENDDASKLGKDMVEEIRESLNKQGFFVESANFKTFTSGNSNSDRETDPTDGVDFVG